MFWQAFWAGRKVNAKQKESSTKSFSEQMFIQTNPILFPENLLTYCIWLDFAFSTLTCKHSRDMWETLQGVVTNSGWLFAAENLVVVCDRPTKILLDEDNQIHGEGESAIEFSDDFACYANHGSFLPKKYASIHTDQWQPQWIIEEESSEIQRLIGFEIGAVRLCQELPMTEIGSLQEYTLLKLDNVDVKIQYILQRFEPESNNVYAAFVHLRNAPIEEAMQYINTEIPSETFPILNDSIEEAIRYANQNVSSEQFPLPDESH
ncbi:MAG: DUF6745 domain-containing protein [Cyanobacteria bacterium P01_G01_bin.54]